MDGEGKVDRDFSGNVMEDDFFIDYALRSHITQPIPMQKT